MGKKLMSKLDVISSGVMYPYVSKKIFNTIHKTFSNLVNKLNYLILRKNSFIDSFIYLFIY